MSSEVKQREKQLVGECFGDEALGLLEIAHLLGATIRPILDPGTGVDSGTDGCSADLWLKIGGVEYCVNIRHAKAQIAKDELHGIEQGLLDVLRGRIRPASEIRRDLMNSRRTSKEKS